MEEDGNSMPHLAAFVNFCCEGVGVIDLNMAGEQRGTDNRPFDLAAFLSEAVTFLQGFGLSVDTTLDTSGKLTRCPTTDDPRGKDGAYAVHFDDPATVWCQNWKTGDSGTHCGVDQSAMTDSQRAVLQARIKATIDARNREAAERYAKAAQEAQERYASASAEGVNAHPYAARKGLNFVVMGARRGELYGHDCLVVPMRDEQGNITSLQYIAGDKVLHDGTTDKHFLSGGKKGFLSIGGDFRGASCIAIVEGPATGGAVHAATGLPVVCAFDAGNLKATGEIVRRLAAPGAEILFMADDDQKPGTDKNPGIEAAEKAAHAVGGRVVLPSMGRKADFWDTWHEQGPEGVNRAIEAARASVASRFEVLDRDDLMGLAPSGYIVKGIMPGRGTGAIYGPSTVGKTFVELDLAAHIAEGRAWFGLRVKARPVAILALEGAGGIQKRVRAWEQYHGRRFPAGVKFVPPPDGGFDLRNERDVADLIARLQCKVGRGAVLCIDTLGQALPGGDENGGKDYSLALSMAGRIERALEGFVVLVGHTGKDEHRGLRGNSNLFAGLDMVLRLTSVPGEAGRAAWTIEKSKDGEDGLTRHFRRVVVDLGQDEDGDMVTSCAIEPVEEAGGDSSAKVKTMTRKDAERITAYRECAMRMGALDDEGKFVGLDPEAWKQEFLFNCQDGTAHDTKSKAFRRMKDGLIKAGWIKETLEGLLLPDGFGAHVQIETIEGALQERARTKPGQF